MSALTQEQWQQTGNAWRLGLDEITGKHKVWFWYPFGIGWTLKEIALYYEAMTPSVSIRLHEEGWYEIRPSNSDQIMGIFIPHGNNSEALLRRFLQIYCGFPV